MARTARKLCITLTLALIVVGSRWTSANDLVHCGYHEMPLDMQQLPAGSDEYHENERAMFFTYNDYMPIYWQTDFDGVWGRNGENEFGGYPSDAELNEYWGFSWGGSMAMACTRSWCECCEFYETDVIFNPAYDWTFDKEEAMEDSSKSYYHSVLLHELGHTWGMQVPSDIEDYQYEHPTVMHGHVTGIVPDELTIHYPEAYLMRRAYDDQMSVPQMSNMVVVSKYAHPTDLTWRNSHSSVIPLYVNEFISVNNLTVENTGTEDLSDVHLRIYLEKSGVSHLIGDFAWDEFPAETYGVFDYFQMVVPWDLDTGSYKMKVHVTMNGYEEDDRQVDSRTELFDPVEILGREIDVSSPTAGDVFIVGDTHTITWDSENAGSDVKIQLSTDNGSSWSLVDNVPNTGSYDWTVPGPLSSVCRIKVSSLDFYPQVNDTSLRFSMVGRHIEVQQPNGGEVLNVSTFYDIRWTTENAGDEVELLYSCTGNGQFLPITPAPITDVGFYDWEVPVVISENCLVQVRSVDYPDATDTSDNLFAIAQAGIDVLAPQADDTWHVGEVGQLEFTYEGACGVVEIHLNRNLGDGWTSHGSIFSDSSPYLWVVTDPPTETAIFRIRDACDNSALTYSEIFTIAPPRSVEVTSPNGGELWAVGESYTVTWNSLGAGDTVSLWFGQDLGTSAFYAIDTNAPNTGSYSVTVPPEYVGDAARIKVVGTSVGGLHDWGDADFSVVEPSLEVVYPNGGELLIAGDTRIITWTSSHAGDFVSLEYRTAHGSWTTISGHTPNDGSHNWLVPEMPTGSEAAVRVRAALYPSVEDLSDAFFTFATRSITVTSPAGGELFDPGRPMTILWDSELAGRDVTVKERCDRQLTWTTLAAHIDNGGGLQIAVSPPRRDRCRVLVSSDLHDVQGLSAGLYAIRNSAPVAVTDVVTTPEDVAIAMQPLDNDSDGDGDELTIVSITQPGHGTAQLFTATGRVNYTPHSDYHGSDSFTYQASDGHGGTDTGTLLITVDSVNDDPVAVDDDVRVWMDTSVTISVLANDHDVDGDTLEISGMSLPMHGTVTLEDDQVTYTPDAGFVGADSFGYSITDGNGGGASAIVHITVEEVLFADGFESGNTSAWH